MGFAPLSGTRVLDFSWNVAGPTASKVLAALGADVVKIEWPTRSDPGRALSFSPFDEAVFDSSGFFSTVNVGKRSFTVDPTSAVGRELVDELIKHSDIVVESYSPRVMTGWGWTFDRMLELNPDIIYLSVSGFGHTGPQSSYVTYGPTAQAASGVTSASGEPDTAPAGWGYSFLDVMTGYQAALAVIAARHRQLRGHPGQRLDVSQVEVGAAMLGPILLDCSLRGTVTSKALFPPGNRARWPESTVDGYRYELGAPYNVYPTNDAGHDGFCAISVLSEAEWAALRTAMGNPEWAQDQKYVDLDARLANQNELDMHMCEWTKQFGKYELMELLQRSGVRAGALQTGKDRLEHDPALRARNVFQRLNHDVLGEHRFESLPVQVDGEALPLVQLWPIMGKHTEAVLRQTLGMSEGQIAELAMKGAIWPDGVPRPEYKALESRRAYIAPSQDRRAAPIEPGEAPLAGIRVLELDAGYASYAGKMLSDLGATVIKIEPAEGSPERVSAPIYQAADGNEHSIPFAYYNAGKKSVAVDLADAGARDAVLEQLIADSDILLDAMGLDVTEGWGLTSARLAELSPGLIHVVITPFGMTGPWRHYLTSDLVALTVGGVAAQTGYDSVNGRPGQPISPTGGQSRHFVGTLAALTAISALQDPKSDGVRTLDFSVHDAVAVSTESYISMWEFGRAEGYRHTGRHASAAFTNPAWQFRCQDDGYVCALTLYLNDRRFAALIDLLDSSAFKHDLADERFSTAGQRAPLMQEIVNTIALFCREHTADYIYFEAQKRLLPWAKVRAPEDIAVDEHLRARGFFIPIELFPGEQVAFPGLPWQGLPSALNARAKKSERVRAPRLGEDSALIERTDRSKEPS